MLSVEEDLDPEHGHDDPLGMRRSRSNRLERARRHLDMWGRMGRSQPGRYWRGGWDEIVEEEIETLFEDSGYSDEEEYDTACSI